MTVFTHRKNEGHMNNESERKTMRLGKISDSILKRTVLKQIKFKRDEIASGAGVGEDCAIFALSAEEMMVSCMQEAAVATPADMAHLVTKCANNLATAGAEPVACMITFFLPERASEEKLKKLMESASYTARNSGMQIAGGQTSVSPYVTQKLAVVTGYGKVKDKSYLTTKGAKPGQDIVISKWIGLEGTSLLANMKAEELQRRYPAYLIEEAKGFDKYLSIIPEALAAMKSGVCVMHDASEGGIMAALWELADSSGVGLNIDLKKLPIRQETVEVCEFCNVNPYELLSGGCLVMTAEDGNILVEALDREGITAVVVGKITDSNDRIIYNEEEKRYLDKPKMDEIHKFLS